ncbi:complement factor H-like isoform X2 [Leucoraja erinacea]|uniref:complement factor H-like isoform X2 n=1 Tax=Leucoraja erinaceus TaxID=7782 RepID=UPI002458D602|nr:complement factor H-like isoform X2 [Leucoraja erinacea]
MKLASIISVSIILRWAKCQDDPCQRPEIDNAVPSRKHQFQNGETFQIHCTHGYKLQGDATIECTDGEWQIERSIPACIEITCPRPQINIELRPNEWRYQLQAQVGYRCRNGMTYWSRCTRNGWEPAIICRSDPCQRPEIDNAVPSRKHRFQNEEIFRVRCSHGYKLQGDATIKCTGGEWQIERSFPACIELGCVKPPTIENGDFRPKKARYHQDEVVAYSCLEGYYLFGESSLRCGPIGWPDPPKCIELGCVKPPTIENGDFRPKKARYHQDEVVAYSCLEGYYLFGESSLRCGSIGWPDPPKCIDMQSVCMDHYPLVEHGFINTETSYKVSYECHAGYYMEGSEVVICSDGKWSQPPTCSAPPDPKQGCIEMPPPLKDGDILGFDFPPFRPGQTVTYQCQDYYIMEGNERVTCSGGKWSKSPRCLAPCILTQEDFDKNSLSLKWKIKKRIYIKHGDAIEFKCPRGFQVEPPGKQVCQNGKMEIPKCISDDSISCIAFDYFDCPTCARDEICIHYNIRNISMTRPDQSTLSLVAHHGESDASFSLKSNRITFNVTFSGNFNIRFGKTT